MPNPLLYVCSAEKGRSLYVIASAIPEDYASEEAQKSVEGLIHKFDILPKDEVFQLYIGEDTFEAGISGGHIISLNDEYIILYLVKMVRDLVKSKGWRFGNTTPVAFANSLAIKQYHKNWSRAIFNSSYENRWSQGTITEPIPS